MLMKLLAQQDILLKIKKSSWFLHGIVTLASYNNHAGKIEDTEIENENVKMPEHQNIHLYFGSFSV